MSETARARIEALLNQRIGLSVPSIGEETVAKAVDRRKLLRGIADDADYLACVEASTQEWDALVELVVVPETWFFRNKESFAFLTRHIRFEWRSGREGAVLRVLSLPCATGEEPYSIGMALMDSGLPPERFRIDAVDISEAALEKARRGVFGKESFRGGNVSFRERYFTPAAGGYQISPEIRDRVRFHRGNLLDERTLLGEPPYDILFCRNLLIYLTDAARSKSMRVIQRLLLRTGILFVGHVERPLVCVPGFAWIRRPGVFACRRTDGLRDDGECADHDFYRRRERTAPENPKAPPRPSPPAAAPRAAAVPTVPRRPPREAPPPPRDLPPSPARQYLEEAQRMADQGELDKAFEMCEKCLRENAFHIQAYFLMGLIRHAQDEEERAEEFFNKAVYLDPNHHEALSHLAFIMEHRGEPRRAERLRGRAQRIREREEAL